MSIAILILKYTVCYCAFFAALLISKSGGGYKLFDEKGPAIHTGALLGLQIAGILWLGIMPVFIFDHSWIELVFGNGIPGLISILIIILLLFVIVLFARAQSGNLFNKIASNQKSLRIFSNAFILRYTLLRSLFLCAYEIFFRGYLLTDSIYYFGIVAAVILNVAFYALLHLPAGKKEMIACIPFGTLLCAVCVWFNAAWPAIALHVSLSLAYELNLFKKFYTPIKVML